MVAPWYFIVRLPLLVFGWLMWRLWFCLVLCWCTVWFAIKKFLNVFGVLLFCCMWTNLAVWSLFLSFTLSTSSSLWDESVGVKNLCWIIIFKSIFTTWVECMYASYDLIPISGCPPTFSLIPPAMFNFAHVIAINYLHVVFQRPEIVKSMLHSMPNITPACAWQYICFNIQVPSC